MPSVEALSSTGFSGSAEKSTESTGSEWAGMQRISAPVCTSHTRTVSSNEALARMAPEGAKHTEVV